MSLKMWNTLVPVVEIISVATAEDAIAALAERLREAGFDPYLEGVLHANAFESEES